MATKSKSILEMNGGDWELFTNSEKLHKQCEIAALHMSHCLHERIELGKEHIKVQHTDPIYIAKKIRDEMYEIMGKYSHLGARDTEPECVLVDIIEREFVLDEYSLER